VVGIFAIVKLTTAALAVYYSIYEVAA